MTTEPESYSAPAEESFAQLVEQEVGKLDQLRDGGIVQGKVIALGRDNAIIDIGFKSEGTIPIAEFHDANGNVAVNLGDEVDVYIEASETDEGHVLLSKEKADRLRVWDEISAACQRDELIEGTITSRVKGGLAVTIRGGVKAFLPGSQVDLRPVRHLDKLLGQSFQFRVIKFHPERGNIVLSRRALLQRERDELKQQTLQNLEEGQVVTGVIKNLTEYGAFVDLGGIDGLLHITDMSWGRVNHPSEVFGVGDEVTVKILRYNADTERVSLGLKQTTEDPWSQVSQMYPVGSKVKGRVVSLTDYGAFVEMEQGVEGLIHVSEISHRKLKHPSKLLEVEQEVECVVLEVDALNKRISLGLKQLTPDPWESFIHKYNPGDIIRGQVRSLTDYGVFVGIDDAVDGMVHRSDLSWSNRIGNPSELYRKGDEVEAIILSINHDEQRVSLGIKQLYEDPWNHVSARYPEGSVVEVRLVGFADDGVFAEVERGVEGFASEMELSASVQDLRKSNKIGAIVKAEIRAIEADERRIDLSFRNLDERELSKLDEGAGKPTRVSPNRSVGPSGGTGATLGDLLQGQFGKIPSEEGNSPEA